MHSHKHTHTRGVYVLSNEFYFDRANRKKINFIGKNVNTTREKKRRQMLASQRIYYGKKTGKQRQYTHTHSITFETQQHRHKGKSVQQAINFNS